ncbi:MAG TPA: dienelactone hydrolase family protein [Ilumatobacteraceae bacterium]|nr:dienelactone hydrolase family protein [Ilumatobacteraceae bacterium]
MTQTRTIEYQVGDIIMSGHLCLPDSGRFDGRRPAVLLSHEGGGQDDNVRSRAERLADLGYVAFALDYFGQGRQPAMGEAQARLVEMIQDVDGTRRIARAGLDVLLAESSVDPDRVAAIGFCFGGYLSLELARDGAHLQAVVGFHPGLSSPRPADSAKITAAVLMCCGADDPIIPPSAREAFIDEMKTAGVNDWRIEIYGGVGHSFTNPAIDARQMDGFTYDDRADRRSWRSMLDLFAERLNPS